ncbi:NUDIX hydrolase [Sphingomonas aracearum]|uniref:NUDIX hydrolase n=1 Tax=Sphingomonas aracearum TaxID=2283317 RepID=A0A369VWL1_9SPHN|nr:NUDIX hydrolase [Sphingomonas aracearum]RDE06513.1 NUDIX hydrolase [Sphingomonas aracearum]
MPDLPSSAPTPAIPAATLVIFRDSPDAPELLMVERAKAMAFAAGALVFPGGRVDPGDRALAAAHPGDPEDTAARIAAIRETIEEAGLALGLTPLPDDSTLGVLREGLVAGEPFAALLERAGLRLDLAALEPFARWRPDHALPRIFDTRFYLAALPSRAPEPVVDNTENVRVFWMSAADVLAEADAGRASLIFPTRRNLERLAQFRTFDEALADARAWPIRTVTPWREERGGVPHLVIPDDLGYPVTAQAMSDARRG